MLLSKTVNILWILLERNHVRSHHIADAGGPSARDRWTSNDRFHRSSLLYRTSAWKYQWTDHECNLSPIPGWINIFIGGGLQSSSIYIKCIKSNDNLYEKKFMYMHVNKGRVASPGSVGSSSDRALTQWIFECVCPWPQDNLFSLSLSLHPPHRRVNTPNSIHFCIYVYCTYIYTQSLTYKTQRHKHHSHGQCAIYANVHLFFHFISWK